MATKHISKAQKLSPSVSANNPLLRRASVTDLAEPADLAQEIRLGTCQGDIRPERGSLACPAGCVVQWPLLSFRICASSSHMALLLSFSTLQNMSLLCFPLIHLMLQSCLCRRAV